MTSDRASTAGRVFLLICILLISIYAVDTYRRNAKWIDELTIWKDSLTKSPSKSRPHTYAGIENAKKGRLKEALHALTVARRLNPADIEARYNLSILYIDLKRYDLAERELLGAIRSRPDLKQSYIALAGLYINQGRFTRAIDLLKETTSRWPDNKRAYIQLALAYAQAGDIKKARGGFMTALSMDPEQADALIGLGNISLMEGRLKDALRYYEQTLRIRPYDPETIYNTALTYERLSRFDMAERYYALFIKKVTSSSNGLYLREVEISKSKIEELKLRH